ncbi:P-loop containing nucleoside triphosphate hydrolase protein [Flagelloscypha sp. PMI_526]|nr:P-loop containing nucleoside triphosphate hydrolase protein [Flagelloscypha sp. PMI_526]
MNSTVDETLLAAHSAHFTSSFLPTFVTGLPGGILSMLTLMFVSPYMRDSLKFMFMGSLMESGRIVYGWLSERIWIRPHIRAHFYAGDPTYEWLMHFLMERKLWQKTRDFNITTRTSKHKWSVSTPDMLHPAVRWFSFFHRKNAGSMSICSEDRDISTDYVPQWADPHFLKWNGYWLDVTTTVGSTATYPGDSTVPDALHVTFFTSDTSVLPAFIQEARENYLRNHEESPHVIIHLPSTAPRYAVNHGQEWAVSKQKPLRPLNTVTLEEGVLENLVKDVRNFLHLEEWYNAQGIPHRRGYLLHGPPGTGKTSTIYALAGELGLEIYSCSLSGIDDDFLQRLAASIPRKSIFLIEDIDCAFPSREDQDDGDAQAMAFGQGIWPPPDNATSVTMSGLLNVLDGVGSDEGRIFFATTNYPQRLDPALSRPGRIDRQIGYSHASVHQLKASWDHFYPPDSYTPVDPSDKLILLEKVPDLVTVFTTTTKSRKAAIASTPAEGTEETAPPAPPPPPPPRPVVGYFQPLFNPPVPLTVPLPTLTDRFISLVPAATFSTAELQGYLLLYKFDPEGAADNAAEWIEEQLAERKEREEEVERKKVKKEQRRKEAKQKELEWEREWKEEKKTTEAEEDIGGVIGWLTNFI